MLVFKRGLNPRGSFTNDRIGMARKDFAAFVIHVIHERFFTREFIKQKGYDRSIHKFVDGDNIAKVVTVAECSFSFHGKAILC